MDDESPMDIGGIGRLIAHFLFLYLTRLRDRPSHIGGAVVEFGTFYMCERGFSLFPPEGQFKILWPFLHSLLTKKHWIKILSLFFIKVSSIIGIYFNNLKVAWKPHQFLTPSYTILHLTTIEQIYKIIFCSFVSSSERIRSKFGYMIKSRSHFLTPSYTPLG